MVKTLTEGKRTGQYLVNEDDGYRARETVTFSDVATETRQPGEVVGQITAGGKYVKVDPVAIDGSEVAAGICYAKYDVDGQDVVGVIHNGRCSVNEEELGFGALTAPQIVTAKAELVARGIKLLRGTQ